ncbi:hypothetical protein AMECASPLE_014147 [Ameca splendens]|uniref:Uncharacterized protein n=1 Tax=Ameca splendens TaxID=208324 RepID=A0ABV0ZME3_9TELE
MVCWEGPGREKPLHHNTGGDDIDPQYKPVKVSDILICGRCRITCSRIMVEECELLIKGWCKDFPFVRRKSLFWQ